MEELIWFNTQDVDLAGEVAEGGFKVWQAMDTVGLTRHQNF